MDPISLSLENAAWERKRWFLIGWSRAWCELPGTGSGEKDLAMVKRLSKAFKRERVTAKRMWDPPAPLNLPEETRAALRFAERGRI